MRETLFILIVLLIVLGLTAYRYRKQIAFAMQIWRTLKGVREMQVGQKTPQMEPEPAAMGELVSCSKCGKWTPATAAIKFGPAIYYCSTKCLQSKVKI